MTNKKPLTNQTKSQANQQSNEQPTREWPEDRESVHCKRETNTQQISENMVNFNHD